MVVKTKLEARMKRERGVKLRKRGVKQRRRRGAKQKRRGVTINRDDGRREKLIR